MRRGGGSRGDFSYAQQRRARDVLYSHWRIRSWRVRGTSPILTGGLRARSCARTDCADKTRGLTLQLNGTNELRSDRLQGVQFFYQAGGISDAENPPYVSPLTPTLTPTPTLLLLWLPPLHSSYSPLSSYFDVPYSESPPTLLLLWLPPLHSSYSDYHPYSDYNFHPTTTFILQLLSCYNYFHPTYILTSYSTYFHPIGCQAGFEQPAP